jgi:hypothetical protein
MKPLEPSDVQGITPVQPDSVFFSPFHADGFTNGLYIAYNAALYPVLGRVLAVHPSVDTVAPGDVVHFLPSSYDWVHLEDGRSFALTSDKSFDAVLDGYDDDAVAVLPEGKEDD